MDFNGNGSNKSIEPLEELANFYTSEKWKFHRYFYPQISHRILSQGDAAELAKDLTQDTFTLAVEYIMGGKRVNRLRPFVWEIAKNRLKMFYRADKDYLDFMHNTRERDMPSLHDMNNLNELLNYYGNKLKGNKNSAPLMFDVLAGTYNGNYNLEEHLILDDKLNIIFKMISGFEKKYRDAIILHYFYQVKYDKIAQMNGIMESTARNWAHRAKSMLADRIKKVYFPKSKTW